MHFAVAIADVNMIARSLSLAIPRGSCHAESTGDRRRCWRALEDARIRSINRTIEASVVKQAEPKRLEFESDVRCLFCPHSHQAAGHVSTRPLPLCGGRIDLALPDVFAEHETKCYSPPRLVARSMNFLRAST